MGWDGRGGIRKALLRGDPMAEGGAWLLKEKEMIFRRYLLLG